MTNNSFIQKIYVIGSGPAGVSAARALLNRGLTVTMLDVGIELEKAKQRKLNSLAQSWSFKIINEFKYSIDSADDSKLSYGSDYVYRGKNEFTTLFIDKRVHYKPSFAKGGLSNVWGSFITPYILNDLTDWPISLKKLELYYHDVLLFMPIACSEYEKGESFYPRYTINSIIYKSSGQAKYLLDHYQKNQFQLNENNIQYGAARLAVRYTHENGAGKCIYCGLCQYGCPYQLIYSAHQTVTDLAKNNSFTYVNNLVVDFLEEVNNRVIIHAHDFHTREQKIFHASQVFVACGAIRTTELILSSLKHYNKAIKIYDSQHFMLPAILYRRFKNVRIEKLHTLCQLYLRITNKTIVSKPIQLQIYTYMELFEIKFKKLLGCLYPYISVMLLPFLERMIVIQGFLHSDNSSQFSIQLNQDNTIKITLIENHTVKKTIKSLGRFLFNRRTLLGFIPLNFLLAISKVGKSYHYGGSFPMRSSNPGKFETDIWGRLNSLKRVNIVDASIFPSIPSQSITFTIMANATRIASECKIYE